MKLQKVTRNEERSSLVLFRTNVLAQDRFQRQILRKLLFMSCCLTFLGFAAVTLAQQQGLNTLAKGLLLDAPRGQNSLLPDNLTHRTIYEEGLNSAAGWSKSGSWEIGTFSIRPDVAFTSLTHAVTNSSGNYSNNADDWLISPAITLPATNLGHHIFLNFTETFEMESGYDRGYVKVSLDNGSTWVTLSVRDGRSDWRAHHIDITSYANKRIKFAFHFFSDESRTYSGWDISRIEISEVLSDPLTATVTSLNSQNFPFIYTNVAVDTFGVGISNLTKFNFQVYEDGLLQTDFFEVTPPEVGGGVRLADIVFVLDVTGSMSDEISAVRQNMLSFVNSLNSSGINYGVGFVVFGDIVYTYNAGNMYFDQSTILSVINNIQLGEHGIGDGADEPENQLEAMALASTMNFRPGAQKVQILLTDAHAHEADGVTSWTVNSLIDLLAPATITVFPVFDTNSSKQRSQYLPIAQATNSQGTYYHIYDNFNAIINDIGNIIANSYLVRYRSDDDRCDGALRNVEVRVSYQGNAAIAHGTYVPCSAPSIRRTNATIDLSNTAQIAGGPLTIAAEITDSAAPFLQSATLFYRTTGTSNYATIPMSLTTGNIYQAVIPGSAVATPGLDYYITATDGQSTSSSPTVNPASVPHQIAVLPNQPPDIAHTPVTSATPGSNIIITANVTDNTNFLTSVELHYREVGTLLFNTTLMSRISGDTYETIIPAAMVGSAGIEYLIRAVDDFGLASINGIHTINTGACPPSVFDDFEDGNANDWHPVSPAKWTVQENDGDLAYCLVSPNPTGNEYTFLPTPFGDFDLELEAKSTASSNKGYLVVFGADEFNNEPLNHYVLRFLPNGVTLFRVVNGNAAQLRSVSGDFVGDNSFHRVKIERTSPRIRVSVDGGFLFEVNDATLGQGYIGFGVRKQTGCFDNVAIRPLNCAVSDVPDLVIQNVVGPSAASVGQTVNVTIQARNQGGPLTQGTYVVLRMILSQDPEINLGDPAYIELNVPNSEWTGGATVARMYSYTIPNGFSGTYYWGGYVDAHTFHTESNENNNALAGNAVSIGASLNRPSNLVALALGTSATMTWQDNSSDEDGFRIERKTESSGTWQHISNVGADISSYTDTGLVTEKTYYYRVRAYRGSTHSGYSNEYFALVMAAPNNFSATAVSISQINLGWTDISNLEDGFRIERKVGTSGSWSVIAGLPQDENWFSDTNVSVGNTYYYRVRAYHNSTVSTPHYSDFTPEKNATPHEPECSGTYPETLYAYACDLNDDFFVDSRDQDIIFEYWNTDGTDHTSYRSPDINQNGIVDVQDWSIVLSFWGRIVPVAVELEASATSNSIVLDWTDVSQSEGGFLVERRAGSQNWQTIANLPADTENYSDHGVVPGNPYSYRVRAYADAVADLPYYSCYSNEIMQYPRKRVTTVITHGYTPDIGNPNWGDYLWLFSMANAVSPDRQICIIHAGVTYKTNLDSLQLSQIHEAVSIIDLLKDPFYFDTSFTLEKDRDIIFVFDWITESDILVNGYLEAAADLLAAILVENARANPWLLENLHFIGHSRGSVIISEAIERLLYFAAKNSLPENIGMDSHVHMTTLDAHPAGWSDRLNLLFGISDDGVNSSNIGIGVVGWKAGSYQTAYIDNYYETTGTTGFTIPGLPVLNLIGIPFFPGVVFRQNLDDVFIGELGTHSLVHTWYHGTVDLSAHRDEFGKGKQINRTEWYTGSSGGETEGFFYSDSRRGELSPIAANPTQLISISDDLFYGQGHLIFNGDFSKHDERRITPIPSTRIPGWEFHGGGGDGHLGKYDNWTLNPHLELDTNNEFRAHNFFYIPRNAESIHYRVKVKNKSNDGDLLKVFVGNTLRGFLPLKMTRGYENREINISRFQSTVQTIRFEIEPINDVDSEVWIDDVNFVPTTRMYASVASPVYLHAYDAFGNHTGPTSDSTWVTEIPRSQYLFESDTLPDPRKTIILPPPEIGTEYRFAIESQQASGDFSFQIEDYTSGSRTVNIIFDSVAIEPRTVATCTLAQVIPSLRLNVDINGDGQTDTILRASNYLEDFKILASSGPNGSISPRDTVFINYNDSITFTITPVDGYEIANVFVDGESVGPVSSYMFGGITANHTIHAIFSAVTSLGERSTIPKEFSLSQNYPNPFNAEASISFEVPHHSNVRIDIFNIVGQRIRTLVQEVKEAGTYQVTWDGTNDHGETVTSGIYICRMRTSSFYQSRKMVLIR